MKTYLVEYKLYKIRSGSSLFQLLFVYLDYEFRSNKRQSILIKLY